MNGFSAQHSPAACRGGRRDDFRFGPGGGAQALDSANLVADDIDLIVWRRPPDDTFPATATKVQAGLGITMAPPSMRRSAPASCTLWRWPTISSRPAGQRAGDGAETFTRLLDWNDRSTCVLFGDGAGAVVLESHDGDGAAGDFGILSTHLHTDGRQRDILLSMAASATVGHVRMNGKEVFRAVQTGGGDGRGLGRTA